MKRRVRFTLVALHFGILLSGMCKIPLAHLGTGGQLVDLYGRITGARGGFGFFSPNVGDQFVVHFDVETKDGTRISRLEDVMSQEAAVRVGNMYRLFGQTQKEPKVRRAVAASLSTHLFEVIPDAKAISFRAELYRFPGLADYRRGKRPRTYPVYRAKFVRKEAGGETDRS